MSKSRSFPVDFGAVNTSCETQIESGAIIIGSGLRLEILSTGKAWRLSAQGNTWQDIALDVHISLIPLFSSLVEKSTPARCEAFAATSKLQFASVSMIDDKLARPPRDFHVPRNCSNPEPFA